MNNRFTYTPKAGEEFLQIIDSKYGLENFMNIVSKNKRGRKAFIPLPLGRICLKFDDIIECLIFDKLVRKGEGEYYYFTEKAKKKLHALIGCMVYYLHEKGLVLPNERYNARKIAAAFFITFKLGEVYDNNHQPTMELKSLEKALVESSNASWNYEHYKHRFKALISKFKDIENN